MPNYLGETVVNIEDTPYKNYTKVDWALYIIQQQGQIEGNHHKASVLDQVVRILTNNNNNNNNNNITIKIAEWDNGNKEYRIEYGEPTEEYHQWVKNMRGTIDEDGEYEYEYDSGINV